jgi:hypothetical protein
MEILFVLNSSRDNQGKRVLIREGMTENYLWPGDESQMTDAELRLLGLTRQDQQHIAEFFASVSDWYLPDEGGDMACQPNGSYAQTEIE